MVVTTEVAEETYCNLFFFASREPMVASASYWLLDDVIHGISKILGDSFTESREVWGVWCLVLRLVSSPCDPLFC